MTEEKLHNPTLASLYREKEVKSQEAWIPREEKVEIYLNGVPLVILPASPGMRKELAVGFLFSGGLLEKIEDLSEVKENGNRIEVEIKNPPVITPEARRGWNREIGSGCGGGANFNNPELLSGRRKNPDQLRIPAREILRGGKEILSRGEEASDQGRGLHYSFLWAKGGKVAAARDIARHNTVDKVVGDCLLRGVDFTGAILFISGRISSEMVFKAAWAGIPILVSLHTPTDLAVEQAERLGLTVIGFLRKTGFTVFSHPERITRDKS
ncbi:MAG: formate dehydrogenase accessory sulfurtransferase FdhD [Proteobacteria bacterium]|nr:formate dehydrogenase accessory sulfurtransferase FdhD [Pseudomonadota bacterium]